MTTANNTGTCEVCKQDFSKRQMTNHLAKCTQAGSQVWFHVVAQQKHDSGYWLHLRILPQASLYDLDGFLRDIWLECCGHLSEFQIENRHYTSHPEAALDDRSMAISIGKVLEPGMKCRYTYDFGTSTELEIRVVAERRGAPDKVTIRLLARNHSPQIACDECQSAPAVQVCTQCSWQGRGWVCDAARQNMNVARKGSCRWLIPRGLGNAAIVDPQVCGDRNRIEKYLRGYRDSE